MQEGTLYRHILKDALRLTWKYKILWIFGFFTVFWGGVGAYQSFNQALERVGPVLPTQVPDGEFLNIPFESLNVGGIAVMVILALVLLALGILLMVVVVSSRGGLIYAIVENRNNKRPTFSKALRKGLDAFWPLLGIGLLARLDLPLYFLLFNSLDRLDTSIGMVLFVLAFIIITIVSLILSLLGIYASALVILERVSFRPAIQQALRLFSAHWLVSLEMALLLYLITMLIGIGALIALFVMAIPFLLLGFIAAFIGSPVLLGIIIVPAVLIYVGFLILAGSAFITFQYSAWILLYLRISKEGAVAKVVRLTSRFGHILHRKIA